MSAIKNENKMQVFVRVSFGQRLFVKINDVENITIPIFLATGNFSLNILITLKLNSFSF